MLLEIELVYGAFPKVSLTIWLHFVSNPIKIKLISSSEGQHLINLNTEMKNMADYSMNEEKWNARVALIENDLDSHDRGDMAFAVKYQLTEGTNNEQLRKKYWQNISNMYTNVENNPISSLRGKASTLPQAVQDSLTTLKGIYAEGHSALFATHQIFGEVESKRGAYSIPYGDSESYVEAQVALMADRMTTYYTNFRDSVADKKQWNGKLNKNDLPTIVIPTKVLEEVEG